MRDGKDTLIRKVEQYKPLIVCFNGKGLYYKKGNTKHVNAPSKHRNKKKETKKVVLQHKSYLFGSLGRHIKQVLLNHGSYFREMYRWSKNTLGETKRVRYVTEACHKTVRLGISVPKCQVTMITPVCSYL